MIVMKFGGTSVGNAGAMKNVVEIIRQNADRHPIVILSAVAGTTNALFKSAELSVSGKLDQATSLLNSLLEQHVLIAENLVDERSVVRQLIFSLRKRFEELKNLCSGIAILGELTNRSLDAIVSMGEIMSSSVLFEAMKVENIASEWIDARRFMITDENFGNANPLFATIEEKRNEVLSPLLRQNTIIVTQGYIGASERGITTTLGRGGSDYSAAIVGASLNVEEIQIWTDVDGILTADPRLIPAAKKLKLISYKEAAELAHFGAKVLHPSTIWPAVQKNIPLVVLNSKHPSSAGTRITGAKSSISVKSIASKRGITVVNIQSHRLLTASNFMKLILDIFEKYQTPIELFSTSVVSASVTIEHSDHLDTIVEALGYFSEVTVYRNKAIVCIVGERLHSTVGVADKIFSSLKDIDVIMISQGASEVNVSLVIDENDVPEAVRRLHREFFENIHAEDFFEEVEPATARANSPISIQHAT